MAGARTGQSQLTGRDPRVTRSRTRRQRQGWALLLLVAFGPHALAELLLLKDAPVPGWPELQIETRYVARIALRGFCLPVPAGTPIAEALRAWRERGENRYANVLGFESMMFVLEPPTSR